MVRSIEIRGRSPVNLVGALQPFGADYVAHLVDLRQHAIERLNVVDLHVDVDVGGLHPGIGARTHAQHVDLLVGDDGGESAQQAGAVIGGDAHRQRIAPGVIFPPYRLDHPLRIAAHQLLELLAILAVYRDAPPLGDETDDAIARDRLAATRDMGHQVADPLHDDVPLGLALNPVLTLLLQLGQQFLLLLLDARLVQLGLEEVHQLIDADITGTQAGQQIVVVMNVVACIDFAQHLRLQLLAELEAVALHLLLQGLLASQNILVAVDLAEPGGHLGPGPTGAQETHVRVHPVATGIGLLLGDDLDLIPGLQRVGEGDDAAIHLGADAAVPDHAVYLIGKVERRGPHRQVDHLALGGEDIDPILEHLGAQLVDQRARLDHVLLPGQQLAQPGNPLLVAGVLAGLPLLVLPVGRDPELGILVHLLGADLNFHRLAFGPQHHGMDGLVTVGFGVGDIVIEFARNVVPLGVNDAESGITILQAVGNDPHRTHVIEIGEAQLLLLHLAPDAVDVFRAAINIGLNPGRLQRLFELLDEAVNVAFAIEALFIQQLGNLLVGVRMQVTEGEILELPLELTDAQTVGQRRVDVGDLLGHQHPGLFVGVFHLAQAGDAFGQLDDHGAHILDHRQQHAPHVVDLGIGDLTGVEALQEADRLHVDHPLEQLADGRTEVLLRLPQSQVFGFDVRIKNSRPQG